MTQARKRKRLPRGMITEMPASPREPPLDEAEAILADIDGPDALAETRQTARSNQLQRHSRARRQRRECKREDVAAVDTPHLGIFWYVLGDNRPAYLLSVACPLAAADEYGDRLTSPAEHYKTWEGWRRGKPMLPIVALASVIARDEYEAWPRGRIVYDSSSGTFVIYADHQLLKPTRLDEIKARFHLPPDQTVALADLHYRSARAIGPP